MMFWGRKGFQLKHQWEEKLSPMPFLGYFLLTLYKELTLLYEGLTSLILLDQLFRLDMQIQRSHTLYQKGKTHSHIVIWVGVAAVCWAIWRCRNDIIFNKIKVNSILQVIFRGTYWFRFWAQLQQEEHAKNTFSSLSRLIEIVALNLVKGGCKHVYRLQQFEVSLVTGVLFFFFKLLQTMFFWLCMSRHRGRIGNPLSKKMKSL